MGFFYHFAVSFFFFLHYFAGQFLGLFSGVFCSKFHFFYCRKQIVFFDWNGHLFFHFLSRLFGFITPKGSCFFGLFYRFAVGLFSFFYSAPQGFFIGFSLVVLQPILQVDFCRFIGKIGFFRQRQTSVFYYWRRTVKGFYFFLHCEAVQFGGFFLGFQPNLF